MHKLFLRIKEAGGFFFADEAYRLIPMQKADDKDYGLKSLEESPIKMLAARTQKRII